MKSYYQANLRTIVILLSLMMPLAFYGQTKKASTFDRYLYLNGNAGITQYFGDLNSFDFYNAKVKPAYGFIMGYQFSPIFGVRGQFVNGKLLSERKDHDLKLESSIVDGTLDLTLNLSNLIGGYKDRTLSFYGFGGAGVSSFSSRLTKLSDGTFVQANGKGNTPFTAINELVLPIGFGASFALAEKFDLNLEYRDCLLLSDDKLDMFKFGAPRDYYGYASLGLTYKFMPGANIKKMANNSDLVKYEVIPNPLEAHGDSIKMTIKGTYPPKYFSKKSAILFAPQLKYPTGTYALAPITLKGEDVEGDGTMINYDNGGSFSYTQTIPYTPALNASEMMVTPLIYIPKEPVDPKATAEDIKAKYKYAEAPERKIADGVIYTGTRIAHDEELLTAEHGYLKEEIISKTSAIYFLVNKYDVNWKLPLNKDAVAKQKLVDMSDFIKKGYVIRDIDINGWASPEGEESYNESLSEKRTQAGTEYMTDLFKKMNKDKKSTIKFSDPEKMIKFNTKANGEDWDGFVAAINASNIPDKNIVLNVVKSQSDLSKREQEIRNMTIVYREIEEDILPSLRRVEIAVNCFEPKRADGEITMLATKSPDSLTNAELLYAATLAENSASKAAIYKSAATIFPNDWKAQNNAGVSELENGNIAQAAGYLNKANSLEPNNAIILNNLGVLEAKKGERKKAEGYFSQAQKLGANESYNQGIVALGNGDYAKASSLFGTKTPNTNVALAQMMAGNNSGAIATLKNAPKSPLNDYLMAVLGARTNDTNMLLDNLKKAIAGDASFKAQALQDREFIKFFNNPEFMVIVK